MDATIASVVNRPTPTGIKMATVVIAIVPIMSVYPFLQKYFAEGIMLGSIKG
jgi:putative aldouronate transport system permease protein